MSQGTAASGTTESMMGTYKAPYPDIMKAYMDNLTKGGFLNTPTFDEMFGSYKKVAEREAGRQSAQMTEALGSMGGGRLSTAQLNTQSKLRENTSMDLADKASQYQMMLRQQQAGEVLPLTSLAFAGSEAGMGRMWADFMRRTSPPPLLDYLTQQTQSYGLPATVVS